MPACRIQKSWVQTANFWHKPCTGSFIQKISWLVVWTAAAIHSETIFVCSNRWSTDEVIRSKKLFIRLNSWGRYPFEKSHHSFERLRLSIQKKASVWMAEVIHLKKSSSTARFPRIYSVAAEPFVSTCSQRTLFFGRLNIWNHVPNVSLAVQTTGVTRLKLLVSHNFQQLATSVQIFFVSRLNSWHHLSEIFCSPFKKLVSQGLKLTFSFGSQLVTNRKILVDTS